MRVLVSREPRSKLSFAFDEGARDVAPLPRFAVGLFNRPDDQSAHGRARLPRALAQFVMQGLGDIDGGSYSHGFIMSLTT